MQTLLLNLGLAVIGTIATFAVRMLIASVRTKDYFDRHVHAAERAGFVERRVRIRDGLELNVAEGPAGGTPLLMIPGQGCIWQEYATVLPALVDTHHVLVVDVHGHGASTWNPDDYRALRIADDMATLIERTFGTPVVIAGHSSGGLIASLVAAGRPDLVRGVLFEDVPFFSTALDRLPGTYVYLDALQYVRPFLAQDEERDWVCWYMPRSYWKRWFGPLWKVFTRSVVRQRREAPGRLPIIRWCGVGINRIWGTMSQPYDLRFGVGFVDGGWFHDFDQAETLSRISCPTIFIKATTRHDKRGNLLAALDEHDLEHVEALLRDNTTVRVRSSHDVHFAHPRRYVSILHGLPDRPRAD